MWLPLYLCPYDDPVISGVTCVVVKSNGYMCYTYSLKGTSITMFSFEFGVSQIARDLLLSYGFHLRFLYNIETWKQIELNLKGDSCHVPDFTSMCFMISIDKRKMDGSKSEDSSSLMVAGLHYVLEE